MCRRICGETVARFPNRHGPRSARHLCPFPVAGAAGPARFSPQQLPVRAASAIGIVRARSRPFFVRAILPPIPKSVSRWMIGASLSSRRFDLAHRAGKSGTESFCRPLGFPRSVGRCDARYLAATERRGRRVLSAPGLRLSSASCCLLRTRTRRCGCAGRSYPSHSASQARRPHAIEAVDASEPRAAASHWLRSRAVQPCRACERTP
jgi:hypothetical protein